MAQPEREQVAEERLPLQESSHSQPVEETGWRSEIQIKLQTTPNRSLQLCSVERVNKTARVLSWSAVDLWVKLTV